MANHTQVIAINPTHGVLLTQHEARYIRDALCAINVIGAPMLKTGIHRAPSIVCAHAQTLVFEWVDLDDDLCQVVIYETKMDKSGKPVETYNGKSSVEQYDHQNAFFKAYGIDD